MVSFISKLANIVQNWPGAKTFGFYSFLPAFFVFGASLEFCMIKWTVKETNFYKVYKRNLAKNLVDRKEFFAAKERESVSK